MKTIDIYARVSRAGDKRMRSTSGQVTECKTILADRGYTVGEVFIDASKSAWNRKVFRAEWERLMQRLEAGQSDGVIVYELTRFTRRSREGLRLCDLAENGLIVLDSEREHDLTTGAGRKIFRDAISDAEAESDKISMRTTRGKLAKVRDNGENNCSTRAFGFEIGNIVAREDEALELRKAAKQLIAGVSQSDICRDLNARGVATALGNPWKPPSLRVALLRPANVGDVVHRGQIVHVARHPGILDRDVYEQVCAIYGARKRGRPVVNLATGFVKCGCGHAMHAKDLARAMTPYPDGSPLKAYLCIKRDGGCGNMIDWFDLNGYVRELTLTILSDPAHAQAIEAQASQASAVHGELAAVDKKIAELDATAEEMGERLGSGQITLKRHDAIVGPLDAQLLKLHARKAELAASMPARVQVAKLASRATWERRWAAADIVKQRGYVKSAFGTRLLGVSAGPRLMPARDRCGWLVRNQAPGRGDIAV